MQAKICRAIGCALGASYESDFCIQHTAFFASLDEKEKKASTHEKYPQYFKDFSDHKLADVYAVHQAFELHDPSGALHHASKKILLSGVRTGGKSTIKDITEARDTLNRWLELHSTE